MMSDVRTDFLKASQLKCYGIHPTQFSTDRIDLETQQLFTSFTEGDKAISETEQYTAELFLS